LSWGILLVLVVVLGLGVMIMEQRRRELQRMHARVQDRERAVRSGGHKAKLQYPLVDLSRCLGCGTCVAACPEDGVLELVHGQALVVNGARCAGVSACERECPVGAITITLDNLAERRDVPALTASLEAVGTPGLFLAGEVTAHALIKTAIEHGTLVAREVAARVENAQVPSLVAHRAVARTPVDAVLGRGAGSHAAEPEAADSLDLLIVGAGPAGLACALEAKRLGISARLLDQEDEPGGTVAKYPRRKLVLTQPVELPLYGRLKGTSFTKEELIEMWQGIARKHELPIDTGVVFQGLESEQGEFVAHTTNGDYRAKQVCLAVGRRGTPRKIDVPGEALPKVAYSLLDANSYQGRRVLVVGGGDSAVETALGLADQPGNQVTLVHRKEEFLRIRTRNEERLTLAESEGRLSVLRRCEVLTIHDDSVDLVRHTGGDPEWIELPNDDVFVMAGGVPPFQLLEASGVSFDPQSRPAAEPVREQGTGLGRALALGFGLSLAALVWALWNGDYYLAEGVERPTHLKHGWLRPGRGLGLAFGITSTVMIVVNLLYLLRRSPSLRGPLFNWGSLRTWMTSHVATGILALLTALLHGAMDPQDTVGGHAFGALVVLFLTGAVGRYLYAWIPRAANGRELQLDEVRERLQELPSGWRDEQRGFGVEVTEEIEELVHSRQWKSSLPGRLLSLCGVHLELRRLLVRLTQRGRELGLTSSELEEVRSIARNAHATALAAAHYEDLRAVLSSWRYLHRWVAVMLVLLVALHVAYALTYGFQGGGG